MLLSHFWLLMTPWTVACQAPLSIEFSRQEHWSGLPIPAPGDLPDPGIKPICLASSTLAGRFFTTAPLGKPQPECSSTDKWLNKFGIKWLGLASPHDRSRQHHDAPCACQAHMMPWEEHPISVDVLSEGLGEGYFLWNFSVNLKLFQNKKFRCM